VAAQVGHLAPHKWSRKVGSTSAQHWPSDVADSARVLDYLDADRLDDRPPLVDLGLLMCAEGFRRLLLGWHGFLTLVSNRCRTSRSASADRTAKLSLAMTSLGVPFGTHSPCQNEA